MRTEFLSKAKRVDNNTWVTGYYVYHINRTLCALGDSLKPEDEVHYIMQDSFSDWNMPTHIEAHHIIPKTLCRCTTMKDKITRPIYEGDIITYQRISVIPEVGFDGEVVKGVVVYSEHIWMIAITEKDGNETTASLSRIIKYVGESVEVVGNIYD